MIFQLVTKFLSGAFLLCLFTKSIYAQEPLLILRADGNWPPFEFATEPGEFTGIHIDILNAVSKRTNIPIKIKSVPWNRAIKLLKKGGADALLFVRKTSDREQFLIFYDEAVLSQTSKSVIVRADRSDEIKFNGTVLSLEPYIIGVMSGFRYGYEIDTADYLKRDISANDEGMLIKKLIDKRIDVAIGNEQSLFFLAKKMGTQDQLKSLGMVSGIVDAYIAVSRKSSKPDQIKRIVLEIASFKNTDEYQQLLKKY